MSDQRFYNPSLISGTELKQAFVVRSRQLKQLLNLIRSQPKSGSLHHALVIGPRGAGKTTLILRVMLEVQEQIDLSSQWQPVAFFEESYGVTDLAGLWLAALKHLSDATSNPQWANKAGALLRQEMSTERLEASALAGLIDFCNETGRRLLMFVENLDQIFSQFLNSDDFFRFRAVLQERSEILIIGTASSVFNEISRQDQPFYEFFQLVRLPALTEKETRDYIDAVLASLPGTGLSQALRSEPIRLDTIRRFTGGNPRLIALAARMISESPSGGARDDLERLIDEQTPYFKARIEQLPPQSRAIFHVLAEGWRPMLAREVSELARLPTSQTSAQLRKLQSLGYVESIAGIDKKIRYQVLERFYNIYYLLRFTRSQKDRLSRLIEFITQVFGLEAAAGMAQATLSRLKLSSITIGDDWAAMAALAPYLKDHFSEAREIFREVVRISNVQKAELPDGLLSAGWESARGDDSALKDCVVASRRYLQDNPEFIPERVALAMGLAQLDLIDESTREMEEVLARADKGEDTEIHTSAVSLAAIIASFGSDQNRALTRQRELLSRYPNNTRVREVLAYTLYGMNKTLEALEVIEEIAEEIRSPEAWAVRARLLNSLDRYGEGEIAAQRAIALNAKSAEALFALGVSKFHLRDFVAAEQALTESSAIRPEFDSVWTGLADVKIRLGKIEEAETTLRSFAMRKPSSGWEQLGDFYRKIDRYSDSLSAYKAAIELNPSSSSLHHRLAVLLILTEGAKAAQASIEKAIELNPENIDARLLLASTNTTNRKLAIDIIKRAVKKASPLQLGIAAYMLAAQYGRASEGLKIAESALALAPSSAFVNASISDVFAKAGRWDEAFSCLRLYASSVESDFSLFPTVTGTLVEAVVAGRGPQVLDILNQGGLGARLEPLLHAVREELGMVVEPLPAEIADAVRELRNRFAAARASSDHRVSKK
jgi:tetratricopeptide (TPR) repeat protein